MCLFAKYNSCSFIAGIVERRHSTALERLLWRTCGLNVLVRIVAIDFGEDPLLVDLFKNFD